MKRYHSLWMLVLSAALILTACSQEPADVVAAKKELAEHQAQTQMRVKFDMAVQQTVRQGENLKVSVKITNVGSKDVTNPMAEVHGLGLLLDVKNAQLDPPGKLDRNILEPSSVNLEPKDVVIPAGKTATITVTGVVRPDVELKQSGYELTAELYTRGDSDLVINQAGPTKSIVYVLPRK